MIEERVTMVKLVEVGGRVVMGVRIVLVEQAPQDAQWGRKYTRRMEKTGTHCQKRICEGRTTSVTTFSRDDEQLCSRRSG